MGSSEASLSAEQAHAERIWESVPEGAEPAQFGLRLTFLLGQVRTGERVLDLGCGEGRFCRALAQAGAHPVGVELAAEPLRRARRAEPSLELHQYAGGRLPFADAGFDVAWAGEVLEHVADGLALLDEVRRVLAPGGRLLVSTPDHARRLVWRLALSRRAFERHFDPRTDHVRFFTARTLVGLLEEGDFSVSAVERRRGTLLARAER